MDMAEMAESVISHEESMMREAEGLDTLCGKMHRYLKEPVPGHFDGHFENKRMMVVHMNYYCNEDLSCTGNLIPAEFAIGMFSLKKGLSATSNTSALIDPKIIPLGLRSEVMEMAKQLYVPLIGRHSEMGADTWTPEVILNTINVWFREFHDLSLDGERYLFTRRIDVPVVTRCIKWLQNNSDKKYRREYKVLPLSLVVHVLAQLSADKFDCDNLKMIDEGVADRIISHHQFAYSPELGCPWHSKEENQDGVKFCCKNVVQRMIYNVLGYFSLMLNWETKIPTHGPNLDRKDVVDRKQVKYLNGTHFRDEESDD